MAEDWRTRVQFPPSPPNIEKPAPQRLAFFLPEIAARPHFLISTLEPFMDITIYHNPACSKSRETLSLIRDSGIEPTIVEYLKNPPDRTTLVSLVERMGIPVQAL